MEGLSVGEVARLAGVTVRALHHWEAEGVLVPSGRTPAGYRVYAEADLTRLARVLVYRDLGFSLEETARLLDEPGDELEALRRQERLLADRIARLQQVAALVRTTREARTMGITLRPDEIAEVFGDDDPTRYAEEAADRWGETDAYAESARRTSSYSKEDWVRVRAEGEAVERRFAELLAAGAPADGPEAVAVAEEHQAHISRSYYACDDAAHLGLADLYEADERFAVHYEAVAPGLAAYVVAAIRARAGQ
jgi:MerR family transcriptional regulator, thiopeptide resistance regulator